MPVLAELLDELVALGRAAVADQPPTAALTTAVSEVERLAGEPLRVAMVGRAGGGALMLAEALLQRRVFGRDALGLAAGPIRFRHSDDEYAMLRADGTRTALPVPDAAWPECGTGAVDVGLRAPLLRRMSLVVGDALPDRPVSAVVVVDREPAEPYALRTLDPFATSSRGLEATAFAVIAVQRTDDIRAEHVVERRADPAPRTDATVSLLLPVNLRMAHTAQVGAFDDAALTALQTLLRRGDVERRVELGLLDPPLARTLTAEGLRACLPQLRDGARTVEDVREVALAASGFDPVAAAVRDRWLAHDDALKAASAFGVLAGAAGRAAFGTPAEQVAGRRLGAAVAQLAPERRHRLDEIQVLHLLRGDRPLFPAAETAEALRLLETDRPGVRLRNGGGMTGHLEELILRWRTLADNGVGGGRLQRWAAAVVLRTAEDLRDRLAA